MAKKKVSKKVVKKVTAKTPSSSKKGYSQNVKAILGFVVIFLGFVEFLMFAFNQEMLMQTQTYNLFILLFGLQLILIMIFYYLVSRK